MTVADERRPAGTLRSVVLPAVYAIVASAIFGAMAFFAHQYPVFPGDLEFTRAIQQLRAPVLDAMSQALLWSGLPPQSSIIFGGYAVALFLLGFRWAGVMQV